MSQPARSSRLSADHRVALESLLTATPDAVLGAIGEMSRALPGARAADLEHLVEAEALNRARRARAFGPLTALFVERGDGVEALTFPSHVLSRLWAEALTREPDLAPALDADGPRADIVADRLCARAAAVARDGAERIWPDDGSADRPAQLEALATAFDLSALARRLGRSLPAWSGRPTEAQAVELRAALREAGDIHPDGPERLLDILFAQMGDAWLILKVVVEASPVGGGEALLRQSDLAVFVERLLAQLERRLDRVGLAVPAALDPAVFQDDLAWCASVLSEFDAALDLHPKSPWGARVRDARSRAGARLTRTMRALDKTLSKAFPLRRVAVVGMMSRDTPRLDLDLKAPEIAAAEAGARHVAALRGPAALLGCEAERVRVVQAAVDRLFNQGDQAIDAINDGDLEIDAAPGDPRQRAAHARTVVSRMADLLEALDAADAARTLRRRIASSARR